VTEFAPYAKDMIVLFIAIAQALTILLTIRRERDVKELRELVDAQRLQNVELRALLVGRSTARPTRPKKSKRETKAEASTRDPIANNNKSSEKTMSPVVTSPSLTTEHEAAQAVKVIDWQREIIAGLRAGLKGTILEESAKTPNGLDTSRPNASENELERTAKAINWLKEEADKARENVTNLHSPPSAQKIG
jgi:HAMP domain-containing protein